MDWGHICSFPLRWKNTSVLPVIKVFLEREVGTSIKKLTMLLVKEIKRAPNTIADFVPINF